MTKKHFIALAQAMNNNRPTGYNKEYKTAMAEQWLSDVKRLTEVCRSFNSNFDTSRFMSACGVE